MSVSNFKKNFSSPLLEKLSESYRSRVQALRGQILELKDLEDIAYILDSKLNIVLTDSQKKEALAAARREAKAIQKRFISKYPARYDRLVRTAANIGISLDGVVYYVIDIFAAKTSSKTYMDSVDRVKQVIIDHLINSNIITTKQAKKVSPFIQKGHGATGEAVSELEVAASFTGIKDKAKRDTFVSALKSYVLSGGTIVEGRDSTILNLLNHYSSRVTLKGNIRNTYTSVVSFQERGENLGIDATEERLLKKEFKKFVEGLTPDMLGLKGSPTTKDKIEYVVSTSTVPKGSKNAKVITKIRKVVLETEATHSTSKKIKGSKGSYKKRRIIRDPRTGRFAKKELQSPINLLAILNAKLPEYVARNMISPALVYRTGRFATSVRAIDIQKTPTGLPSIGYTYQKFPYQTFEPGYAQGTPERDPRTLIDKSIREIVAQIQLGRFFTRRI